MNLPPLDIRGKQSAILTLNVPAGAIVPGKSVGAYLYFVKCPAFIKARLDGQPFLDVKQGTGLEVTSGAFEWFEVWNTTGEDIIAPQSEPAAQSHALQSALYLSAIVDGPTQSEPAAQSHALQSAAYTETIVTGDPQAEPASQTHALISAVYTETIVPGDDQIEEASQSHALLSAVYTA
ncbi:MAG: hypothetical protein ACREIA_21585 [Opitutaceae bacterium]